MVSISFCFKRISEKLKAYPFKTGEKAFDKLNEASGTLEAYYKEDIVGSGDYTTYLFTEEQSSISNLVVHGLIRFKQVPIKTFQNVLDQITMDAEVKRTIIRDLEDYHPKVIYLSRIGIQEHQKKKRIGTLIARFFDFLMLREQENLVIYAMVLNKLDIFLSGSYLTIGSGKDEQWGDFFVKYRVIFH